MIDPTAPMDDVRQEQRRLERQLARYVATPQPLLRIPHRITRRATHRRHWIARNLRAQRALRETGRAADWRTITLTRAEEAYAEVLVRLMQARDTCRRSLPARTDRLAQDRSWQRHVERELAGYVTTRRHRLTTPRFIKLRATYRRRRIRPLVHSLRRVAASLAQDGDWSKAPLTAEDEACIEALVALMQVRDTAAG